MQAAELINELRAARERTRRMVDDLAGERELGPMLAIVNPPRWEVGHVGWFQEFWCLRQGNEARASILPNADALYNSATVPHDSRWTLPLPSFADTLAYREAVLEKVVQALKETATKLKSDDTLSPQNIRAALERRFDTGYVNHISPDEIEITKGDTGWEMTAEYDSTIPLFGNLYLQMQFNKTVVIN